MMGLVGYISADALSEGPIPPYAIACGAAVAFGPLTLAIFHGQVLNSIACIPLFYVCTIPYAVC